MFAKRADRWIAAIALIALAAGSIMVLLPFLTAIIWAAILTQAGWPLLQWIENRTGGRRGVATTLLTLLIVVVMLAPLMIVIANLTSNWEELSAMWAQFRTNLDQPPSWLVNIPVVGQRLQEAWLHALQDRSWFMAQLQGIRAPVGHFLLRLASVLGTGMLELALSIFIAFFMFLHGEHLAGRLRAVFWRLGGEAGVRLTELAGNTISGVVYGIMGTAAIQALLTGIGLAIAGVPGAALLGLITFFVAVVPIGPPIIWIPAAIWLYINHGVGWTVFMVVWGVVLVGSVDNFLKPLLISRGSAMPFVLVLMGVMGGVIAFGFIGIFLGPTLLAVVYRLLQEWTRMRVESIVPARDLPPPEVVAAASQPEDPV
ncbi:MAG: AI-2E family transporter [Rhodocyclaceae bacterium]